MIKSLKSFVANKSGATAIEYALIASLIAVVHHRRPVGPRHQASSEFAEVGSGPQVRLRKPYGFLRAPARTSSPAFFVARRCGLDPRRRQDSNRRLD